MASPKIQDRSAWCGDTFRVVHIQYYKRRDRLGRMTAKCHGDGQCQGGCKMVFDFGYWRNSPWTKD